MCSEKTCLLQLGPDQVATVRASRMVHQVLDDMLVTHQELIDPAAAAPTVPSLTPAAVPSDTAAATTLPPSAAAAASPSQGSPATATAAAAPLQGTHPTPTPEPSGLAVNSSPQSALSSSSAAGFPPGRLSVQHEAPWNLRKLQQGRSPSDATFAYTNRGTGVRVYMLDTVRHNSCVHRSTGLSNCALSVLFSCSPPRSHQQPIQQPATRKPADYKPRTFKAAFTSCHGVLPVCFLAVGSWGACYELNRSLKT